MSRLFWMLLGLQALVAAGMVLSLLAPWLGSGPPLRAREMAMALVMALLMGGSAALAWWLYGAGRPGWAWGVVGAVWLLAVAAVVTAAATARWN